MSISIVLPTLHGMGWNAADRRERWNPKRCGELSEAAFLLKATEQGFLVAKPWGDSERFDFIVDSGTRLWRVQLKSTAMLYKRGYQVNMMHKMYRKGRVGYNAEEIDMLVVHIPPVDVWYVLPVEVVAPSTNLRLYPNIMVRLRRWERYREAWGLFTGKPPKRSRGQNW